MTPHSPPTLTHTCDDPECPAVTFVFYGHDGETGHRNFGPWLEWRDLTDSICTAHWSAFAS